jgi:hypothetical protein
MSKNYKDKAFINKVSNKTINQMSVCLKDIEMKKLLIGLTLLASMSSFGNNQEQQEPVHNDCPKMNEVVSGDYDLLVYKDRKLVENSERTFNFTKIGRNDFGVEILDSTTGEDLDSTKLQLSYNASGWGCEISDLEAKKLYHIGGFTAPGNAFSLEELTQTIHGLKPSGKRLVFYAK